jgi:hypothetical protein
MNNNTLKPPLRTELVGSHHCIANGVTASATAPVLALCRKLLAAGLNPDQALEVYRGATLAIRVRSIGKGARLAVEDSKSGKPTFRSFRDRPARDGAALPIAPAAQARATP